MTGNPKTSRWHSTPNALRRRKRVTFTLDPDILRRLDETCRVRGGAVRSALVEEALDALLALEPLKDGDP